MNHPVKLNIHFVIVMHHQAIFLLSLTDWKGTPVIFSDINPTGRTAAYQLPTSLKSLTSQWQYPINLISCAEYQQRNSWQIPEENWFGKYFSIATIIWIYLQSEESVKHQYHLPHINAKISNELKIGFIQFLLHSMSCSIIKHHQKHKCI